MTFTEFEHHQQELVEALLNGTSLPNPDTLNAIEVGDFSREQIVAARAHLKRSETLLAAAISGLRRARAMGGSDKLAYTADGGVVTSTARGKLAVKR